MERNLFIFIEMIVGEENHSGESKALGLFGQLEQKASELRPDTIICEQFIVRLLRIVTVTIGQSMDPNCHCRCIEMRVLR